MGVMAVKSKFSGLNKRFILYFLLFSYIPLLVFSLFGYFLNKELIRQEHTDELNAMAGQIAFNLEHYVFSGDSLIPVMYSDQIKDIDNILKSVSKKYAIKIINDNNVLLQKNTEIFEKKQFEEKNDFWHFLFGKQSLKKVLRRQKHTLLYIKRQKNRPDTR